MNKSLLTLAAVAALAVSAPSFAADSETMENSTKVEKDTNGNYSETDKSAAKATDGTKTSAETKVKNDVSSDGSSTKSVTKKTTHKKGWFNKHSTKTKDVSKTKADGSNTTTHKKTVDGTTTEDTKTATPAQ